MAGQHAGKGSRKTEPFPGWVAPVDIPSPPVRRRRRAMSTGRFIVAWIGSIILAMFFMATILALAGK